MARPLSRPASGRRRAARARLGCVLGLALVASASPSRGNPPSPAAPETAAQAESGETSQRRAGDAEVPRLDADGTYLRPNALGDDGVPIFVHVTPADMPWRVAIGQPRRAPRRGSREEARLAAIEAMRTWERAIQPQLPWFQLEFVEEDALAPVELEWKLWVSAESRDVGRIRYRRVNGELRVGGELQVSTTPDRSTRLTLDQVRTLVTHVFGHALGLGHCSECDSAMNVAWYTRDPIQVTETDVRTFLKLVAQPNGAAATTSTRIEPE